MRVRMIVTTVSALGMLTLLAVCGGQANAASMHPDSTGANHQPGDQPVAIVIPATTVAAHLIVQR